MTRLFAIGALVVALGGASFAQERPASPAGASAIDIGGRVVAPPGGGEPVYKPGKWIEVTYGRPIKRGRDLFGSGADYGKLVNPDAPVWRAGANNSTQLTTELPLEIGGKRIAPGTYTMFIDLKPNDWTLIVSTWKAQATYDPKNMRELWGAYNYTPDKDVVRAKMKVDTLPQSHEQLAWEFLDVTDAGGTLALIWDKTMGSVPFKVIP
jgi:hypothetical protein